MKINTCLIWWTGLVLTGGQSGSLHGQQIDPPSPLATNVVGIGANWIGQPAASLQYMRRLGSGRFGVGGELGMRGLIPQAQYRFERSQRGPGGEAHFATHVWHGSIGALLTAGGFDHAGSDVSGGAAAIVLIGNQLWPEREQLLPGFMDLSIGVVLPQSGMTGMPGIAPFVRVYLGFGW